MSTRRRRLEAEKAAVSATTTVVKPGATHTTEYTEIPARQMSFEVDVLAVSLLVGSLALIVGVIVATYIEVDGWLGVAFAAVMTGVVFFWRLSKLDSLKPKVRQSHWVDETTDTLALAPEDTEEVVPMAGLLVQIQTPSGTCEFYQPRVNEFATWIRTVLRDDADPALGFGEQVTLSKNRSERRNWPPEMYDDMLQQLFAFNLVLRGRNRVPEPTDMGKHYFKVWLSGQTALPSKK